MNSERNEPSEPRQRHKYTQPREQLLRGKILDRYPSLRRFALDAGIPYSTLMTLLTRGVGGASFDTVARICRALKMDIDELYCGDQIDDLRRQAGKSAEISRIVLGN